MIERDWYGLYREGWQGEITPDAFCHPAKFARGLIRKIYAHCLEAGYLREGDAVIDPFGGVALGGLDALLAGLHWTGVELEPRFVALGQANIDLWTTRYAGRFRRFGSARIVQGDSRQLAAIVAEAGAVLSSPPYADQPLNDAQRGSRHINGDAAMDGPTTYGSTPGNLGNLPAGDYDAALASPPYVGSVNQGDGANDGDARIERKAAAGVDVGQAVNVGGPNSCLRQAQCYGETLGQLGAMRGGDYDAALASPPFCESIGSDDPDKRGGLFRDPKRRNDVNLTGTYGTAPGQLGAMPPGDLGAAVADAAVSSPPFTGVETCQDRSFWLNDGRAVPPQGRDGYGLTDGQLANEQADTFWLSARTIVEQTHQVLKPGGVAVWVLKSFVRKGQRVDFPGQWRALCEACGFETLEYVRAWLVEDNGTQGALLGEGKRLKTERKSFFRRLAESKGSPSIDYEVVLFTRKVSNVQP